LKTAALSGKGTIFAHIGQTKSAFRNSFVNTNAAGARRVP
jgi:hypothetical protein